MTGSRVSVNFEASSPAETASLGERLGETLEPGAVVLLTGELGAGKTCFIQGVARGLGVASRATSPTFVLVNEYRGRLPVHHVDLFRVESHAEIEDIGVTDLLGDEGVTLVEWADKLGALLPADAIRVHIEGVGDELRRITIAGSPLA